ncbi:VanZ family protein [Methylobacterium sp. C25]|uniref:VanZ family protein n=1 Tax=Methylobacterium sp. C25 TaxID=2721622 RepID=UPI001F23D1CC|nr:VanZ family protein [Methylobacterium sp. C25]
MMHKLARLMAWMLVVALVVVTLAPIGMRPAVIENANIERALAYALLGFLFAVGYPRHRFLAFAVGVAVAAGLEVGQVFTASRHGRVPDFMVKAVAAGIGVITAWVFAQLYARLTRQRLHPGE